MSYFLTILAEQHKIKPFRGQNHDIFTVLTEVKIPKEL